MSTTTQTPTINWQGQSGESYTYRIYPIGTSFKAVPGNYIFTKEMQPSRHRPLYVGETKNLDERFDDHHKMPCIRKNGATHIHVHQNDDGEAARRREESDLIAQWNPTCNG